MKLSRKTRNYIWQGFVLFTVIFVLGMVIWGSITNFIR
jgi:hypothetical protein